MTSAPFFQTTPWTETVGQPIQVGSCPQHPWDSTFQGTLLTTTALRAQPRSLSCAYGSKWCTATGDLQSKAGGAEHHTFAPHVLEGTGGRYSTADWTPCVGVHHTHTWSALSSYISSKEEFSVLQGRFRSELQCSMTTYRITRRSMFKVHSLCQLKRLHRCTPVAPSSMPRAPRPSNCLWLFTLT